MKILILISCLVISKFTYGQATNPPPPITLSELMALKLTIVNVDYKAGIHEIAGYNTSGALVNSRVMFGADGVLAVSSFNRPNVSIVTIPFKMRGAQDTFSYKAQAGLNNIGFSFNFCNYKMDRYFSTGTKSTHRLSAGFLFAPGVEEIAPETTRNQVKNKTSQLFISTGITLTYSYSDVSFVLVPLGFDYGTTSSARKYIYSGKYWWGFGLGISTKFLGLV